MPRLPATGPEADLWLSRPSSAGSRATGPVFQTFDLRGQLTENRLDPRDVARIVKRRCAAAGVTGEFAGHSLQRGLIANAAKKEVPIKHQAHRWSAVACDRAGLCLGSDDRRGPAAAGDHKLERSRRSEGTRGVQSQIKSLDIAGPD